MGELTALLGGRRRAVAGARARRPRLLRDLDRTCGTRASGPTSRGSRSSSSRACSRSSGSRCRCATRAGPLWAGLAFAVLAVVLTLAHADVFAELRAPRRGDVHRLLVPRLLRHAGWVVLVASIIPWVDAYSVWRGPTKSIVAHHAHVFTRALVRVPGPGQARGREPRHARPLLLRPVPRRLRALRAARRLDVALPVAALGGTIALTVWWNLNGLPALPAISLGFLLPNADLIWRRLRRAARPGDRPNVAFRRAADDG